MRQLLIYLLCLFNLAVFGQSTGTVKGVVKNPQGEALPGVSVTIKDSDSTIIDNLTTNNDGVFTTGNLKAGKAYVFRLSHVGYTLQSTTIRYNGGESISFPFQLSPSGDAMSAVVVVGYGTQKKVNLTGAVAQVSSEVFENRALPNVTQGLQGVIPNLNLRIADGKPIQSPTYNVRGTTSIGQGGSALVLIDGVEGDPSMINPADIASVTVLKDASSAAVYGARGSFGVVLITTKSPAKEKMSITYSVNHSIKKPVTLPDFVTDGYTFAKNFNEAWTAWNDYSQTPQNVNKTVRFSQEYLAEFERRSKDPSLPKVEVGANGEYVYYGSTDWIKELYKKNSSATEHNLAFSGSSEKTSFYVTGRYFGQDGVFRYNSDDFKTYNFRAKGSIQVFPWLRFDNNMDYSKQQYHNPLNVGEGGSIWRNIADEGHNMAPMFNPDGTLSYSAAYTVGDFWYGKNGIDMNRRVIRNTTGFVADIIKNTLRLKGDFTIRNTDNNDQQKRVPVPYSRKPGVIEYVGTSTNDIQVFNAKTEYLATNIYGEYEKKFGRSHNFRATAGFNYEQSKYQSSTTQRNGLIYPDADNINLALGQSITTNGNWEQWAIVGGFYRLNYSFRDRYLVEFNGRYDGSSKFPANERYAFFPSVSAGWRVSNENFWNVPRTVISDLKLRGSYGSLGNGNINSYVFQEQFSISQSGRIINGIRPQRTSQPGVLPDGLTWETATTTNIGLDLGMVSNRLTLTADAYQRKTTDMFTNGVSLPAVFGTGVPKGNYADLETKGWELTLTWKDYFRAGRKPFNYGIRLTLADNQSEITRYNNPDKRLTDYYVGQKVGEIWGYTTVGYFTSAEDVSKSPKQIIMKGSNSGIYLPGDIKLADLNGDGVVDNGTNTVGNPGDRRIIGNSTPRYTYGIALDADWNNFFFAAFFQGVGKQDWWPGSEASYFWGLYNRPYNRMPTWHLDEMWSEQNPDAYLPRLRGYTAQNGAGVLNQTQTKYLQNIAYIRLKNIQLGYNLPKQLTSKLKMTAARVYVSGENIWTWSPLYRVTKDIDVENTSGSDAVVTSGTSGNGYNYPMLKGYTMGISVTF